VSGQLVSQLGTWLQNAAQAWLILDLTHSAAAVGVLGFCLYAPYAVFGLLGGALADRWDRQKVMMVTQSAMALAAAALALVAYLHVDSALVVDLIALVRGSILPFNNPSRQALMVQLVGRGDLQNAIALNSSVNNATRIVGPAIAGVLIAKVGVAACFALNALSFVAVIVALGLMRPAEFYSEMARSKVTLLESIREGLAYARRTKTVVVLLSMLAVISTMSINFNIVLPVLARDTMHGTAETFGFITGAFGIGAVAGAFFTAGRARASRMLVLIAATGFGAAQIVLATQRSLAGVCVALIVTGACYSMYTASSNAIVQLASPGHIQGRISGLYNYVFIATGPVGSLVAGAISERGGAPLDFVVGGVVAIAMAGVGWLAWPWPMPTGTVRVRRRSAR
jgi:MFS family permease